MKYVTSAIFFTLSAFSLIACKNNKTVETVGDKKDSMTMSKPITDSIKFAAADVDNMKDPTCGMPVGAGIEDTAHYNNKVIGFCSKECKDEFLKNAAKNITAVEWKK